MTPTLSYPKRSLVDKIIELSKLYEKMCNKDYLYIYLGLYAEAADMFEVKYRPEHFAKLCGVHHKEMDDVSFYNICLHNPKSISIEDIVLNEPLDMEDVTGYVAVLEDLLHPEWLAKYRSDEILPCWGYVRFEDCFDGYDPHFIGRHFDAQIKEFIHYPEYMDYFPCRCTHPKGTSALLTKEPSEILYGNLIYQEKRYRLDNILYNEMADDLSKYIDTSKVVIKATPGHYYDQEGKLFQIDPAYANEGDDESLFYPTF